VRLARFQVEHDRRIGFALPNKAVVQRLDKDIDLRLDVRAFGKIGQRGLSACPHIRLRPFCKGLRQVISPGDKIFRLDERLELGILKLPLHPLLPLLQPLIAVGRKELAPVGVGYRVTLLFGA